MKHAPPSHFTRRRRFGMLAFMIAYHHALQECLCHITFWTRGSGALGRVAKGNVSFYEFGNS